MKLIKPKFWIKKTLTSYILYPSTIITYILNIVKSLFIKKEFKIKTICVGNIIAGGSGKTTLTIELSNLLRKKLKFVFIKKNYLNQIDEINLLKKNGPVIYCDERIDSLNVAVKKKYDLAILDDGLQQKNIKYDLNIVCFNSDEGIGNGFLIPAGPLRENLNQIKAYDIAFLIGQKKNKKLYKKIKSINRSINVFEANYKPLNLGKLNRKKKYLMFCGIGNPHEFKNTLLKYNFKVQKEIIYPDHYDLSNNEIKNIKKVAKKEGLNIITTEKDFNRLSKNQKKEILFLKVKLNIKNSKKLKKIIFKVNEKN